MQWEFYIIFVPPCKFLKTFCLHSATGYLICEEIIQLDTALHSGEKILKMTLSYCTGILYRYRKNSGVWSFSMEIRSSYSDFFYSAFQRLKSSEECQALSAYHRLSIIFSVYSVMKNNLVVVVGGQNTVYVNKRKYTH